MRSRACSACSSRNMLARGNPSGFWEGAFTYLNHCAKVRPWIASVILEKTHVGALGRWMKRNPLLPSRLAVLCCALSSLEPSCSAPISGIMSSGARASPALSQLPQGAGLWPGAMQWHRCGWRPEAELLLERGKGRGWPAGPHSVPLARGGEAVFY